METNRENVAAPALSSKLGQFLIQKPVSPLILTTTGAGLFMGLGPVTSSVANRHTARASSVSSGSSLANITAWRRCQFSSFMPPPSSGDSLSPSESTFATVRHRTIRSKGYYFLAGDLLTMTDGEGTSCRPGKSLVSATAG